MRRIATGGRVWAGALALAAAAPSAHAEGGKAQAPIPAATLALMAARHTGPAAPLVVRTFKKEAELEIWKLGAEGRYVHVKTFPICRWSGQLGPKHHAGDRQTPEGFYAVAPRQMNPNSHYYLSFDTGFPNAYDRAHGWSGSAVMVHGTCSSMGCFAMTDAQVGEIYAIAREALKGGQPAFQMQAYPFHMTARNMALYRNDANIAFWNELKEGSDRFEATGEVLTTGVAGGRYTFAPSRDPAREAAAQTFHKAELARIAALVADGSAAVRTTYSDGGQNAIFAALLRKGVPLGDVSRPEALAFAGIDVTLVPARRHPRPAALPDAPLADAAEALAARALRVRYAAFDPPAAAVARLAGPLGARPGNGLPVPFAWVARAALYGRPSQLAGDRAMTDTLPDRLATNPKSPFYDEAALERGVGVRFDGVEKTNVDEYCVSEGWVRLVAGVAKDRAGNLMTIKLKGKVEPYFRSAEPKS